MNRPCFLIGAGASAAELVGSLEKKGGDIFVGYATIPSIRHLEEDGEQEGLEREIRRKVGRTRPHFLLLMGLVEPLVGEKVRTLGEWLESRFPLAEASGLFLTPTPAPERSDAHSFAIAGLREIQYFHERQLADAERRAGFGMWQAWRCLALEPPRRERDGDELAGNLHFIESIAELRGKNRSASSNFTWGTGGGAVWPLESVSPVAPAVDTESESDESDQHFLDEETTALIDRVTKSLDWMWNGHEAAEHERVQQLEKAFPIHGSESNPRPRQPWWLSFQGQEFSHQDQKLQIGVADLRAISLFLGDTDQVSTEADDKEQRDSTKDPTLGFQAVTVLDSSEAFIVKEWWREIAEAFCMSKAMFGAEGEYPVGWPYSGPRRTFLKTTGFFKGKAKTNVNKRMTSIMELLRKNAFRRSLRAALSAKASAAVAKEDRSAPPNEDPSPIILDGDWKTTFRKAIQEARSDVFAREAWSSSVHLAGRLEMPKLLLRGTEFAEQREWIQQVIGEEIGLEWRDLELVERPGREVRFHYESHGHSLCEIPDLKRWMAAYDAFPRKEELHSDPAVLQDPAFDALLRDCPPSRVLCGNEGCDGNIARQPYEELLCFSCSNPIRSRCGNPDCQVTDLHLRADGQQNPCPGCGKLNKAAFWLCPNSNIWHQPLVLPSSEVFCPECEAIHKDHPTRYARDRIGRNPLWLRREFCPNCERLAHENPDHKPWLIPQELEEFVRDGVPGERRREAWRLFRRYGLVDGIGCPRCATPLIPVHLVSHAG